MFSCSLLTPPSTLTWDHHLASAWCPFACTSSSRAVLPNPPLTLFLCLLTFTQTPLSYNMSLGYKRSREEVSDILPYGSDSETRSVNGRDVRRKDEPKDWRDAHLKSDRNSSHHRPSYNKTSSRKDSRDYDHSPRDSYRGKDRRYDDRKGG